MPAVEDVTIIGAGLGGLALAIALHQKGIPCRVFEYKAEGSDVISAGVSVQPNGCKVLDSLGVLERIAPKCWIITELTYRDENERISNVHKFSSKEVSGYDTHRLYRLELIKTMKEMLAERQVPIIYDSKFEGVVEETAKGVRFRINGKVEHASFLVGADGIHSAVRKHLTPKVAEYVGTIGAVTHVPTDSIKWPSADPQSMDGVDGPSTEQEKCATFMGKSNSLIIVPEVADGSDLAVAVQLNHPGQTREGWEALGEDKEQIAGFFTRGYDSWGPTAKSILDSVREHKDKMFIWPYRQMEPLDSWASEGGRVAIVGDAAHSIPPSSAQGVNQALEDVYTFALLFSLADKDTDIKSMLNFWRQWRQARIQVVLRVTDMTNYLRASPEVKEQLEKEGKGMGAGVVLTPEGLKELTDDIFCFNADADMAGWFKENSQVTRTVAVE